MQIPPSTVATPRRTSSWSGRLRKPAQHGDEVRRGRLGPCGTPQRRWERVPGFSEATALSSRSSRRRRGDRRPNTPECIRQDQSSDGQPSSAATKPASPYAPGYYTRHATISRRPANGWKRLGERPNAGSSRIRDPVDAVMSPESLKFTYFAPPVDHTRNIGRLAGVARPSVRAWCRRTRHDHAGSASNVYRIVARPC